MLNRIIDLSLRNRLLVCIAAAVLLVAAGVRAVGEHPNRCVSRHHPRTGADKHRRSITKPARGRTTDNAANRARDKRAPRPCKRALGLEIRPVSGGRYLR